jgi:hypothetical protein
MKGKEFLKRIFFSKLIILPPKITDAMAEYTPPVPIPHDVPNSEYKVIYAVKIGTHTIFSVKFGSGGPMNAKGYYFGVGYSGRH